NSYRDLIVWQRAMDLAVAVYTISRHWPKEELYGLTSQVRRSATSVAANIAEGYGRENRGSYLPFLRIAQGSLKEMETHLMIAERIGLSPNQTLEPLLLDSANVGKLLRGLIRKLADS
ncbi:MAG TPA: four helix bundle protein, partial [Mycoplana sp.]|nr:four helix bundle protein [Mycoplana sp.]